MPLRLSWIIEYVCYSPFDAIGSHAAVRDIGNKLSSVGCKTAYRAFTFLGFLISFLPLSFDILYLSFY
jgi:hypothetical protein